MKTILASGSRYRHQLLERLNLAFTGISPDINETPHPNESPTDLALRLSLEKAQAISSLHPDALVIGSDQIAVLHGQILGKPGTRDKAIEQLTQASGQRVTFLTGLCIIAPGLAEPRVSTIPYHVEFRELKQEEIERYIDSDQPLDCAGSFKWEKLGISLFKRMEGDDPTALEGLPLITLSAWLRDLGHQIP
ncbi:Maf family protein [Parendozoicomonas haliclonae]|uniref:7-methyl-GTP pyrophosphatase n=1 Tax=Parendozoicomonas haliclonae TaxID=1960125 RepID=A0A1X7AMF8_9GAMM|nr:nucleoside triphosphate pyrophosphatase [Parendozoicomonas haliclonae]SMA49170.1 Maf-like protein YceF [Parendozoicomonas haliclonae]